MPLTPYGGDGNSDWLQSLLASYGAGQPYGPGGPPAGGVGPRGAYVPGGGVTGYQAATPGAPSMGYPAMGQAPPAAPAGAAPPSQPFFQFGGFHPGNILQSHPPGSASLGPVFNASGSPGGPGPGPGGPGSAGDDGGFNNPYMAAAGANPPQGGPYVGSGQPAPGFSGPPSRPYTPTPQPGPMDPSIIARQSPGAAMANAPPGNPSATPRPARPVTPTPRPKTTAASSNPRFGQMQYQVPGSGGGPLSRSPIYSTLNLFGAKG